MCPRLPGPLQFVFILSKYKHYIVNLPEDLPWRSTIMVERFEKFSLNFSFSLFVIRVNLLHP